ncbi:hypothetical protein VaNZ11_012594 [Volvox africanus]|uniref:Uncharacterized protein n=1 Tax=Volvox africanus TaxID=51714 RepID=A0ABQ5SFX1_9CHLO|nr:hypothetical protein VaNZ11_012594 [Volvox africanus]
MTMYLYKPFGDNLNSSEFGITGFRNTSFSNTGLKSASLSANYMPASHCSLLSSSPMTFSAGNPNNGALVLYHPNSLHGLYYDEHVHGPLATGRIVNPFTPGLSPLSSVAKPNYAKDDALRERFPAVRAADDPLNWITDEELDMRTSRAAASQQRTPLRCQSMHQ